ncbi:MAG: hypothetical protein HY040_27375 [Planctomycetes bacterium]|nr:hypothetical protein [Planctomycetota bacterium]
MLALASESLVYGLHDSDSQMTLWDLSKAEAPTRLLSLPLKEYSCSYSISPNGRFWIVEPAGKFEQGRRIALFEIPSGKVILKLPNRFGSEWWSPEGRRLMISESQEKREVIRLFDLETAQFLWQREIDSSRGHWTRHGRMWVEPRFTHDSKKLVVTGPEATVDVIVVEDGEVVTQIPFPAKGGIDPPALTPNERFLLIRSSEPWVFPMLIQERNGILARLGRWLGVPLGKNPNPNHDWITVWDLHNNQEIFHMNDQPVDSAALSPDGCTLLTFADAREETKVLTCWDVPSARPWRWILGLPAALGFMFLVMPRLLKVAFRLILGRIRRSAKA